MFYNTSTQPATGLRFTSIQLTDTATGTSYNGTKTNTDTWDMVGQGSLDESVRFPFVIERGRIYTLSMTLGDIHGNSLPYLPKDIPL